MVDRCTVEKESQHRQWLGIRKEPGKFKGLKEHASCLYRRGTWGRSIANWAKLEADVIGRGIGLESQGKWEHIKSISAKSQVVEATSNPLTDDA